MVQNQERMKLAARYALAEMIATEEGEYQTD